jgi:hypothetical protein
MTLCLPFAMSLVPTDNCTSASFAESGAGVVASYMGCHGVTLMIKDVSMVSKVSPANELAC